MNLNLLLWKIKQQQLWMDLTWKMSIKVNDKVTSQVFTAKNLKRGESLSIHNCLDQRTFAFCVINLEPIKI